MATVANALDNGLARTPPMVSAYIAIEWRTCENLGVECIDTVDIQEPLWDASPDWNHPPSTVLAAMAARIAAHVLGQGGDERRRVRRQGST